MDNVSVEFKELETLEVHVEDINYIPSYKIAELERQANEKERIAYYNEIQQKVANGEFNGERGERGEQGIQGVQGERGEQGEKGDKGDVGDTGYTLTNTVRGESVTIEDAVEFKLFNLEIDGKSVQDGTPTPDAPVEIDSVGYTNLWKQIASNTLSGITLTTNEDGSFNLKGTASANANFMLYVPISEFDVEDGEYYCLHTNKTLSNVSIRLEAFDGATWLSSIIHLNSNENMVSWKVIKPSNVTQYRYLIQVLSGATIDYQNVKLQLEKGSIAHSYIPYGKSGIEVKTVGKNLFNLDEYPLYTGVAYNGKGNEYWSGYCGITKHFPVVENTTYSFSNSLNKPIYYGLEFYDKDKKLLSFIVNAGKTFTTPINCKYIRFATQSNELPTWVQIEKGSIITEYEPYKENISVLQLNAPLRSLPNGVKDITYIKNNKLYVDRYVGSVVLNGSESWSVANSLSNNLLLQIEMTNLADLQSVNGIISDHFIGTTGDFIFNANDGKYYIAGNSSNKIRISLNKTEFPTMSSFTNWLETNNVQVDYALATPVTEEVDDYVIINTYAGVNNIDLAANLETEFSVTYAQDMKSILKDYPSMEEIQAYVDSQLGTINEQLASLTEVE